MGYHDFLKNTIEYSFFSTNCFFLRRIIPLCVATMPVGRETSISIPINSMSSSVLILPLISTMLSDPSRITELIPIRGGHPRLIFSVGHLHSMIHFISDMNSSFWCLFSSMRRVPIKNASNKSKNINAHITNIDMSRRSVWRREVSFSFFFSLRKNVYTFFIYCPLFFQCVRQDDMI